MRWHWIDDIHNWHRFRSVQLGLVGGACGAALTAYGAAYAIDPRVVSGVPHWVLTVLTVGSMVFSFAASLARAIDQPSLSPAPHQGDTP